MQSCVVFSSRPVTGKMRRYIKQGAYIIGADAGWRQADSLGLSCNLVVGDFDSSPPPQNFKGETIVLSQEKDDTDTHFAAKEAIKRGFTEVCILGGLGGRLDHTLANLHTLLYLAQQGVTAVLADETTEIYCFSAGEHFLQAKEDTYLSVFAAGGPAVGVTLQGVKYPLQQALLTQAFPVGVSNEFLAGQACILLKEGYLFVMVVRKEENCGN